MLENVYDLRKFLARSSLVAVIDLAPENFRVQLVATLVLEKKKDRVKHQTVIHLQFRWNVLKSNILHEGQGSNQTSNDGIRTEQKMTRGVSFSAT